jgi:hypothetical protein
MPMRLERCYSKTEISTVSKRMEITDVSGMTCGTSAHGFQPAEKFSSCPSPS